jgi:hypothetical protein
VAVLGVEPPITLTIAILLLAPFGVYPFFREFCIVLARFGRRCDPERRHRKTKIAGV